MKQTDDAIDVVILQPGHTVESTQAVTVSTRTGRHVVTFLCRITIIDWDGRSVTLGLERVTTAETAGT